MKRYVVALFCILGLGMFAAAQSTPTTTSKAPAAKKKAPVAAAKTPSATAKGSTTLLKTQNDKASYAVGMNFGNSLHRQAVDVNPNIVAQGLKDAMSGRKAQLTDDEARAALEQLKKDVMAKQEQEGNKMAAKNKAEGEAFLAANKTKPGVIALPSGLQYKVEKQGTGPKPTATDSVVCHYRGTLLNGAEFDSSYKHGQPVTFPVNGVIKGWTEALQLMPVGSKWQLFIPSEMAYGSRGAGSDIGPDSTLIFEVELVSIEAKK